MRCAVMQPTYFPWAGYFNLLSAVDVFVFLDDAQYERGTWHNRNRVLVSGKPHWLTVPVIRGHLGETLNRVQTDDKLPWRKKHLALLRQVYGRHPFGADIVDVVDGLVADTSVRVLSDLNIRIISALCTKLGITSKRLLASELGVVGKRTERLIAICRRLGCDEYLSPSGALAYLMEDHFCNNTSARLLVNEYTPAPYAQAEVSDFVGSLSIIDVVAHLGWQASSVYIRSGAQVRAVQPVNVDD